MKIGDVVMILAKMDTRIKDIKTDEVVMGTLEQLLIDNQASVLLLSGDIWVGDKKYLKVHI